MRHRTLLSAILLVTLLPAQPFVPRASVAASADEAGPQELEAFQGYLDPAPRGMDVRYAWTLPGGRGEHVRIADIEYNWNLTHNDLAAATSDLFVYVKGIDPLPQFDVDHGTAVLGELVAAADGKGVTGIAHQANLGLINPLTEGTVPNVPAAIHRALSLLSPGDVILLEQQSINGPRFDPTSGRGLVPIEYEPDIFAAIKEATSSGIIVVESAGNGSDSLDHPAYNGAFDRTKRDSGAILVAAGFPEGGVYGPGPDRTRTDESNWGSRVDVQGWGRFVTTCGYGDLRHEQGENNWYTTVFGATSGATAMVAGAAAVLSSIIKERRGLAPTPSELRQLLVSTGTPQAGSSEHIGPRPDLHAAIALLDSAGAGLDPKVTKVKLKSAGKLIVDGEQFTAGDSIVEIDGSPVSRVKYPADYTLPGGISTRIVTKSDVSSMIPPGVEVSITVFTPGTGKRSEPFPYRRN